MSKPKATKILFAGGGTGGHFFPIIAIAEEVRAIANIEHVNNVELFFMSDNPIDKDLLDKMHITYIEIVTGKRRTYASFQNFLDIFKTIFACMKAVWKIFLIYPDVIFGKGGYASFPALFAARVLRIPVVIHESDITPGRVNRWVADYAEKIAISYPEALDHFPDKERVALTGQPIRASLLEIPTGDPVRIFELEQDIPLILVMGGSQGAENINENLIDIMPKLVEHYQVIHQVGNANLEWMKKRAEEALHENINAQRYHPVAFIESRQLRIAAKGAMLVISRAGSTIFEIAHWGLPSILIPLPIARDDHQRQNAYSYARTGAAIVLEEQNLKPEIFFTTIDSLMNDEERRARMALATKTFAKDDAAKKIAQALLVIATKHV